MNKKTATILMLVVVALLGGVILYDVIANKKVQVFKDKDVTNYQWDNKWEANKMMADPTPPQVPDRPKADPKDQPKEQPPANEQVEASSYEDAVKQSEATGKPLLILFSAEWCSWCKKLQSQVLTHPEVKEEMKRFVLLKVDVDQDKSTTQKFGVQGIPAYRKVQGNNIAKGEGYKEPAEFIQWLK